MLSIKPLCLMFDTFTPNQTRTWGWDFSETSDIASPILSLDYISTGSLVQDFFTACEEGQGICAHLLIVISIVFIFLTLPFSLCCVVKVVQVRPFISNIVTKSQSTCPNHRVLTIPPNRSPHSTYNY